MLIPPISRAMNVIPLNNVITFGSLALSSALFFSINPEPGLDLFQPPFLRAGQGGAGAFLFVPIGAIARAMVPWAFNNHATALISMARHGVGGITFPTSRTTGQQQIRQAHRVAPLSPGSQSDRVLLRQARRDLTNLENPAQHAMRAAPGRVSRMLQTRSAVRARTDVFSLTGCAALPFIPVAPLLSDARPRSRLGAGGH